MNFLDAMKLLRNGKKVRRECWNNKESHYYLEDGVVTWDTGDLANFRTSQILADDWEEYIKFEPKTLSNKIFAISRFSSSGSVNEDYRVFGADTRVIVVDDAIESLRRYFDSLEARGFAMIALTEIAETIFGDKLIK